MVEGILMIEKEKLVGYLDRFTGILRVTQTNDFEERIEIPLPTSGEELSRQGIKHIDIEIAALLAGL